MTKQEFYIIINETKLGADDELFEAANSSLEKLNVLDDYGDDK